MSAQVDSRIDWREAVKAVGWFPAVMAVMVGGPSLLAILETVLVEHQLVPALQWIVEGYSRVMRILGGAVEPFVLPILDELNARFQLSLELDPVWRPIFALGMIVVVGIGRNLGEQTSQPLTAITLFALSLGFLITALVLGIFSRGSGWVVQGAVAAAPLVAFGLLSAVLFIVTGILEDEQSGNPAWYWVLPVACFMIGALGSFAPGFENASGVLALAGGIAAMAATSVFDGLRNGDLVEARIGLTIAGGFLTACAVLVANWTLMVVGLA